VTFGLPVYLWGLAALLPLAAIYLLKVRPRRKPVTALFLYQRIFTQKRASSLFHRLRDALSLLLMILAVSAIVLGLAQPGCSSNQRSDLLILIDHSASMAAVEDGRSRLEDAKEQARDIVRALDGKQRCVLASIADTARIRVHLSNNPRELIEAIDGIAQSDLPLRMEAVGNLEAELGSSDHRRVLLLSDGCARDFSLPENVEFIKVGQKVSNIGIVAADLRRSGPDELQLFAQLFSGYEEAREIELVLKHENQVVQFIPVTIEPGMNSPLLQTVAGQAGRWRLEITEPDALSIDNTAYFVVHPPRPIRVRVEADRRYFFEHSILAFEEATGLLKLVRGGEADVVVAEKQAPEASSMAVVFQPMGDSQWWSVPGEPVTAAAPRSPVPDHPALRHLEVASMTFDGARRMQAPKDALVLVESEHGIPLLWQVTGDGHTVLVVNMDPSLSDFFLNVQFPVLVQSMVRHLSGRSDELVAHYPTGDAAPLPGVQADGTTSVKIPGEETALAVHSSRLRLERVGFYNVENDSGTWTLAANLVTAEETSLNNEGLKSSAEPVARGRPPAYWLMTLALVIVLLEGIMYYRRKVG